MPQLLVRNISKDVVDELKRRAARRGVSAEAEHRTILEAIVQPPVDDPWERLDRLRDSLIGRISGDSTDLIREDRDSR